MAVIKAEVTTASVLTASLFIDSTMKWVSNLREFMQGRAGIHESSEGVGKRRGLRAVCGKISADRRWSFRSEFPLLTLPRTTRRRRRCRWGARNEAPPAVFLAGRFSAATRGHCHSAHDDRGSALCATVPSISERAEGRRKDRADLEGLYSDVHLPELGGRSRFYGPDNFLSFVILQEVALRVYNLHYILRVVRSDDEAFQLTGQRLFDGGVIHRKRMMSCNRQSHDSVSYTHLRAHET